MIKISFVFLLSLFSLNAFAGFGGYIGKYDNRRYGSLSEPEYNGVVKLSRAGVVKGTGVFISKNIILTNNHCLAACKNGCNAEFWNGSEYETSNLKMLTYNDKAKLSDGTDWGLLLSDKESNFYKSVAPVSTTGQVNRGGYGILRIIEDDEIPFLKDLYVKTTEEFEEECAKGSNTIECINKHIEEKLKESGKKPLFKDANNFKVQTCKILGNSPKSNKMMQTDCDSSGGDSGAPLLRGESVVGLNNGGLQAVFGDSEINAEALRTENFYMYTQSVISEQGKTEIFSFPEYPNDDKDKEVLGPVRPDSVPDETSDEEIQQFLQSFDCD